MILDPKSAILVETSALMEMASAANEDCQLWCDKCHGDVNLRPFGEAYYRAALGFARIVQGLGSVQCIARRLHNPGPSQSVPSQGI